LGNNIKPFQYKNQALEAKVENQELRAKMRDKSLERVKMANNEVKKGRSSIYGVVDFLVEQENCTNRSHTWHGKDRC
jgi:hypothetical protein